MPRFEFTAIDEDGRERAGTLEAPTAERAAAEIKQRGFFPTQVAVEGGAVATQPARRRPLVLGRVVTAHGLAEFTRQLGTLVQAGLPLLRALQVLERRNGGRRFVL